MNATFLAPLSYTGLIFLASCVPASAPIWDFSSRLSPLVHDLLHIPAYSLLAWLWWKAFREYVRTRWAMLFASLIPTFFCGLITEVFQTMVPGRVPSTVDFFFDMCGAVTLLGVCWLMSPRLDPL